MIAVVTNYLLDHFRKVIESKIIIHPFLFALFPIILIISLNLREIDLGMTIRPIFAIITSVGALLLSFFLINKDWFRAGIFATLSVFLFFYYGILFRYLLQKDIFASEINSHFATIIILLLIFIIIFSSVQLLKQKKIIWRVLNVYLNIVAIIMIINPAIAVINLVPEMLNDPLRDWKLPGKVIDTPKAIEKDNFPDIYYIVLDGYGRYDVLSELYNFDNSEFLKGLNSRGFYVADNSYSNYLQTALSLASSLNMMYIQDLVMKGGTSSNREPLNQLISSSEFLSILKDYGYKFVAFDSGYSHTNIPNADIYLSSYLYLNTLEEILLTYFSPAIIFDQAQDNKIPLYTYHTHRSRAQFTLDQISNIPLIPGPKFIFAHIIPPHPPFVFDKDGNQLTPEWDYSLGDANDFQGSSENYKIGYSNQVQYVNHSILSLIDKILKQSSSPPIIVIQGDHGPKMLTDWSSKELSCTWEVASILNAYYFNDIDSDELYPSISPVNTFRVITNHILPANLDLLPDKVYYSNYKEPYKFSDITELSSVPCTIKR